MLKKYIKFILFNIIFVFLELFFINNCLCVLFLPIYVIYNRNTLNNAKESSYYEYSCIGRFLIVIFIIFILGISYKC